MPLAAGSCGSSAKSHVDYVGVRLRIAEKELEEHVDYDKFVLRPL